MPSPSDSSQNEIIGVVLNVSEKQYSKESLNQHMGNVPNNKT